MKIKDSWCCLENKHKSKFKKHESSHKAQKKSRTDAQKIEYS